MDFTGNRVEDAKAISWRYIKWFIVAIIIIWTILIVIGLIYRYSKSDESYYNKIDLTTLGIKVLSRT